MSGGPVLDGLRAAALLASLLAAAAGAAEPGPPSPPWSIPAADLGTQRLFRLRYDGPEGEGGGRLTLRLVSPTRYRISAVDVLGRAVWNLDVDAANGLWIDHRRRVFCRFEGPVELRSLPLSPFELPSLPSVLLGRLPVPAAGPVESREDGALELRDGEGRRWTVRMDGERLERWTLWEGEEPSVWWGRLDGESVLSERRRGLQIRWREVLREPLAGPALAALEVPAGYTPECAGEPPEPPPTLPPALPSTPAAGT